MPFWLRLRLFTTLLVCHVWALAVAWTMLESTCPVAGSLRIDEYQYPLSRAEVVTIGVLAAYPLWLLLMSGVFARLDAAFGGPTEGDAAARVARLSVTAAAHALVSGVFLVGLTQQISEVAWPLFLAFVALETVFFERRAELATGRSLLL